MAEGFPCAAIQDDVISGGFDHTDRWCAALVTRRGSETALTYPVDDARAGGNGPELRVLVVEDTTVSRVELIGELDMATADCVREALLGLARAGYCQVEVDLSGLEFVDVVGARALLAGHRALRDAGGRLIVTGARPTARRMFRITEYDKSLDLA